MPAMTSLDAALAALQAFVPTGDESEDVARLEDLLEPLPADPATAAALAPAVLALVEAHPEAALGTPGPLVRRLEAAEGIGPLLRASLRRAPADLTTWMANRRLNTRLDRDERAEWLAVLTDVAGNQAAAPGVRASANAFLDFQASRPAHGST
jgi:hypothetical protein